MTWVSWRLQRTETLIAAAILALLALLLVPTGIQMAGAYHHDGLAACLGQNPTDSCGRAIGSFTARFGKLGSVADWFTLVPGLVGAILAAPFVLELRTAPIGSRGRRASPGAAGSRTSSVLRSVRHCSSRSQ